MEALRIGCCLLGYIFFAVHARTGEGWSMWATLACAAAGLVLPEEKYKEDTCKPRD